MFNFKLHLKLFVIKDRLNLAGLFIGFVLNILIWLLLYFKIGRVFQGESQWMETIPLHYNIYFGIDLIGAWYKVVFIPLIGTVIFLLNFLLGYLVYVKEKILSYFLILTAAFVQLILLISAGAVVVINIY